MQSVYRIKMAWDLSPPANDIFSHLCRSVCLSTGGGGPHVTITHDAWGLTLQDPSPDPSPITKHQPVLTSGGVATKARTV